MKIELTKHHNGWSVRVEDGQQATRFGDVRFRSERQALRAARRRVREWRRQPPARAHNLRPVGGCGCDICRDRIEAMYGGESF